MLFVGGTKERISIETPKGITFDAEILNIEKSFDSVSCAVLKDGGDDPDATTGLLIYAEVSRTDGDQKEIIITGGDGVGLVTKPGLDQPIGNHAINSVPRSMIEKEVREVLDICDPECGVKVIISAPGGDEIAKKTFNPRLGIVGGISILGTSGIVEPMSTEAIIQTIAIELNQKHEEGYKIISVSPGNYGLDFMAREYSFDLDQSVKCSNYIGAACDKIRELGFEKMFFVGHAGKLVKVAAGIMNTHSREADGRMEIIASAAICEGADKETALKILNANTTEEAFRILGQPILDKASKRIVDKIKFYLEKRMMGEVDVECIMFTNELGILGETDGARSMVKEIKDDQR